VDRELFDRAQAILTAGARRRCAEPSSHRQACCRTSSSTGMGAGWGQLTRPNGQRFRYYVPRAKQIGAEGPAATASPRSQLTGISHRPDY
jgi:hypothetical protein